jgi:hypothetical protein
MIWTTGNGIFGNSQKVAVTLAEIEAIQKKDEQGEIPKDIKKLQPDTNYQKFGAGPEAWYSYTYSRDRELYGKAEVRAINNSDFGGYKTIELESE